MASLVGSFNELVAPEVGIARTKNHKLHTSCQERQRRQRRRQRRQQVRQATGGMYSNRPIELTACNQIETVTSTGQAFEVGCSQLSSQRRQQQQAPLLGLKPSLCNNSFCCCCCCCATKSKPRVRDSLWTIALIAVHLLQVFSVQPNGVDALELAMNLPDGIENILGFVPKSTFKCERDGYFGDIENDCKIFHLCQRNAGPTKSGKTEWRHWTYACGNQTMFNQLTLTCAFVDEAIPCQHSSQFQYLNEVIHKPAEPFLTDADVTSGVSYYSNRIMSDGARARAYQDSQLFAQIGGTASGSGPTSGPTFANTHAHQGNAAAAALEVASSASAESSSAALVERESGSNEPQGSSSGQQQQPFQNWFQPTNRLANSDLLSSLQAATSATTNLFNNQPIRQRQQQEARVVQPSSSSSSSLTSSGNVQPISNQVQASGNLIENHSWQLQHQPEQQQQQQQFVFNQVWPQSQQQPRASSPNDWQQSFSRTQADQGAQQSQTPSPVTLDQQQQQQQQQQVFGGNAAPNTFEFSISTNHANSGSPFNTFTSFATTSANSNQASSDSRGSTTSANSIPFTTTSTAPTTQSALSEQVVSSTAVPTTTLFEQQQQQQQQQTTTTTTTTAAAAPATTTTTVSSSTDAPAPSSTLATTFTRSQRLQLAQPTQTTTSSLISTPNVTSSAAAAAAAAAAATTTTTTTPTATATSSPIQATTTSVVSSSNVSGQARRLAQTSGRRQQVSGGGVRRTNDLSGLDRAHVGFQSERLSAVNRRMASNSASDTPLVMRRQPTRSVSAPEVSNKPAQQNNRQQQQQQQPKRATTNIWNQQQQQQQQQQPAASGPSTAFVSSSSALRDTVGDNFNVHSSALTGSDFWRRSFDAQLMAPKFESILLKRRV